jgi:tetratricopeptide (TPR) repeat protein
MPLTADQLLAQGDSLRASGEHGRALWAYLEAYQRDRQDPRPIERIGGLHLAEQPGKAEEIFQALLQQNPGSASALVGLALARLGQRNEDAAVELLERAVAEEPTYVPALNALGALRAERGNHAEARPLLERAWQAQPQNPVVLNNLGASYIATREWGPAISVLERARGVAPGDVSILNNLGLALACDEREEEALEAFRRAGDEQAAFNNMGVAAFTRGDYDAALAWYERALLERGPLLGEIRRNVIALEEARAGAAKAR